MTKISASYIYPGTTRENLLKRAALQKVLDDYYLSDDTKVITYDQYLKRQRLT